MCIQSFVCLIYLDLSSLVRPWLRSQIIALGWWFSKITKFCSYEMYPAAKWQHQRSRILREVLLLSPDITALSLFLSPRVKRALLRRTKNLTSRPGSENNLYKGLNCKCFKTSKAWKEKTIYRKGWTAIVSKHSNSPSQGLQPGASDRLPSQPGQ